MNWSEVKIFGEMCVLSLLYSYVAVCGFCAVCCVSIICFSFLFPNFSAYVFLIFFSCLFYILCVLCFYIFLRIVSSVVYSYLFPYLCTYLPTISSKWKPNCNKWIPYPVANMKWQKLTTLQNYWNFIRSYECL